ncbi:uncharacterized protein KY384_000962 [Bacidia gigantensis]|uniref:uncharacterized protein n=1 Tax=Bacidia gigantensis TaxID=2732470 RepID=UPI001D0368A7|nr:uncharacterized protein KY384_000962 [Bacidia gigantensis]KAG8534118.1 hypothetical protein KY384_000962 [Bacidia gigantensis]
MISLNEFHSGFENVKHNTPSDLVLLYILPNGAWLVGPSYLIYVFGRDILLGLAIASGDTKSAPAKAASTLRSKAE